MPHVRMAEEIDSRTLQLYEMILFGQMATSTLDTVKVRSLNG